MAMSNEERVINCDRERLLRLPLGGYAPTAEKQRMPNDSFHTKTYLRKIYEHYFASSVGGRKTYR